MTPLYTGENNELETNDNLPFAMQIDNPSYILQNSIINNSLNLNSVSSFMAKQKVYTQLISNADVLLQDASFNSFVVNCNNNSIGKLYKADKLISKKKADSAAIINNSIANTNVADSLHKLVNNYYILYLRNNILSSSNMTQLRDIASLCPLTFGDGVYIARGLLNLADSIRKNYSNICETGTVKPKNMNDENIPIVSDDDIQIQLYPNPAKETVTIEFVNFDYNNDVIKFEVYDLVGKKLIDESLKSYQKTNISTESLGQGIYIYKFIYKNKIVKKDKLVIIK